MPGHWIDCLSLRRTALKQAQKTAELESRSVSERSKSRWDVLICSSYEMRTGTQKKLGRLSGKEKFSANRVETRQGWANQGSKPSEDEG